MPRSSARCPAPAIQGNGAKGGCTGSAEPWRPGTCRPPKDHSERQQGAPHAGLPPQPALLLPPLPLLPLPPPLPLLLLLLPLLPLHTSRITITW